jgi:type IV pilus assembly protein PilX
MTTHSPTFNAQSRQQGIALIMAIILLIIATLTGLAGMRNTTLQEKLSANLYDRAIAMQTAEFALAAAEKWLFETGRDTIIGTASVVDCTKADATCPALPANTFTTATNNWVTVTLPDTFNKNLKAGNPQYFIQYLGLKNSNAVTDTSQSANPLQYGASGGGNNSLATAQNATYRVTVRSSTPTADNDRSIVVLTSLVKSN